MYRVGGPVPAHLLEVAPKLDALRGLFHGDVWNPPGLQPAG